MAFHLAGHLCRLSALQALASVVEGRLVGHIGQTFVVPIPHRASPGIQAMCRNLPLLGQRPVGVLQVGDAAPLIIGQVTQQRVGGHMEAIEYVGGDAQEEDGPV